MVLTMRNYRYGMTIQEGVKINNKLERQLKIDVLKQDILKNLLFKPRAYRLKHIELTKQLNALKEHHKRVRMDNITSASII
jgi:hypothetical protein